MFVSDNVAQSSFCCLLLLYLPPFKYKSHLHFTLFSPDLRRFEFECPGHHLFHTSLGGTPRLHGSTFWLVINQPFQSQQGGTGGPAHAYSPRNSLDSRPASPLPSSPHSRTKALVDTNRSTGLPFFITADILPLLCLLCAIISFSSRRKLNYTFLCSRRN